MIDLNKDGVVTFKEFWSYCNDYNNNNNNNKR